MRKPEQFNDWPESLQPGYLYRATAAGEADGDTMYCFVDLGLYKYAFESLRLKDVDAPEVYSGPDLVQEWGHQVSDFLKFLCPYGIKMLVATERDRKTFDRFVATIELEDGTDVNEAVNGWMARQAWYADYRRYIASGKDEGVLPKA